MNARRKRALAQSNVRRMVSIHLTDEWLDTMDNPWAVQISGELVPLDLLDTMIYTLRACPVQTAGDAERSLDILLQLKAFRNGDDTPQQIRLPEDDFDWMLKLFREHGHQRIWRAPDAAYLCKYLADHKQAEPNSE